MDGIQLYNFFCVFSIGFGKHLNLRKVFPRLPRTERVQIAIAALSFAFADLFLPRTFTVLRTDLIHRQNVFARDDFLGIFLIGHR